MNWIYQGRELTPEEITKYPAFVYLIVNLTNNKKYIGKKLTTKAGYKTVAGKRKRLRLQSDFMDYYGSNEELQNDVKVLGSENFRREILHFCRTKSEASYLELREQIDNRVLESDDYYNSWIMCRVRKAHIGKINEII